MKTGGSEAHEIELVRPSKKGGSYKAFLPHRLYHRIEAHFGKGPFITNFTLTYGPFIVNGYVKTDHNLSIPVEFREVASQKKRDILV